MPHTRRVLLLQCLHLIPGLLLRAEGLPQLPSGATRQGPKQGASHPHSPGAGSHHNWGGLPWLVPQRLHLLPVDVLGAGHGGLEGEALRPAGGGPGNCHPSR